MSISVAITLAVALVGAILGVINTVHAVNRDRVRLRVTPTWVTTLDSTCLGIDVVNIGFLPVSIAEVGFKLRGGSHKIVLVQPVVMGQSSLPHRLEPRGAVTIVDRGGMTVEEQFGSVSRAYVRTTCGLVITGSSPALRGAVRDARARLMSNSSGLRKNNTSDTVEDAKLK